MANERTIMPGPTAKAREPGQAANWHRSAGRRPSLNLPEDRPQISADYYMSLSQSENHIATILLKTWNSGQQHLIPTV
jgi:hypothetical protein